MKKVNVGDVYREKRVITQKDVDTMTKVATSFTATPETPRPEVIIQTIMGSMFSYLIATMVPQSIYVEQDTHFKGVVKLDQLFEVSLTIKELNKKRKRAIMETKIVADDGTGKKVDLLVGSANVKLPNYAVPL